MIVYLVMVDLRIILVVAGGIILVVIKGMKCKTY